MDDDYGNYSSDEGFNEDTLANDEYDALYVALPQVKAEIASYNSQIDELAIKEALYYNYYEISAAIEELKSKFPKKKVESLPPPKISKLALLAKSRASAGQKPRLDMGHSGENENIVRLHEKFESPGAAKISRLAALAKARASKNTINEAQSGLELISEVSRGSKLNTLFKGKLGSSGPALLSNLQVTDSTGPSLSKTQLSRKSNGGGLELRRKLENVKKKQAQSQTNDVPRETEDVMVDDLMDIDSSILHDTRKDLKRTASNAQISFDLSADQSGILRDPSVCGSVIIYEAKNNKDEGIKRRRLSSQLFVAYTNGNPNTAKAKANFSQPSPDDKVLNAQKQAFEQSVQELSIKDEKLQSKTENDAVIPKKTSTKPFKNIDVREEFANNPHLTKPNVSFVIIGHVDAGKSTLMGRILYDTGTVDAKTVNKLVREAEKSGKGSFALAWVMDQTSEERCRGITIDICATNFETAATRFTAIDAPGHKDFVPQMIGGVSQAETALLVVDSITGNFEAGFHMDGQTKEHATIVKNLGIKNLCVAINKLDKENWCEARYDDIKEQLSQYLIGEDIGFKASDLSFVPISGLTGCNIVKNDKNIAQFSWYKGPTLVEHLESIGNSTRYPVAVEDLIERDFNLAINEVYDVTSSEFKVKGKISLGMVQPGESVCIHPTEDVLQIQTIQFDGRSVNVAVEGQLVSLTFRVSQLKHKNTDEVLVGDIVSSLKSSVCSVKQFRANINTFNMSKPLLVGTPFVLFRNNASVAARINKVVKANGGKKKKMHLVSRQNADVIIEILEDRKLPVSIFDNNKSLGRVVLRREGTTIGAGTITEAE